MYTIPLIALVAALNAITDVAGIEVGLVTLISGEGPLFVGTGPIRTGVTAILPRGKASNDPVMAGWFAMNGNGEMTGTASRQLGVQAGGYTVGVLVQANHGRRPELRIAGVPVGADLPLAPSAAPTIPSRARSS